MERDEIRVESKKDLEIVKKFLTRGIEQIKVETAKIIPLSKKHEIAKEHDFLDEFPVPFLGTTYQVKIFNEFSENQNLYEIQLIGEKKIQIFINLKHNFPASFFSTSNGRLGFSILIAYLACCEVHITKKEGIKDASLIRFRLNEICQNIPPRT